MRVACFAPAGNRQHRAVLAAFARGAEAALHPLESGYRACDVAVIFGGVKKTFRGSWPKRAIVDVHKGPLIVLERGFVCRGADDPAGLESDPDVRWSAGFGLPGGPRYWGRGLPGDRWAALGASLMPWARRAGPVLVVGQVPWDVSVQHTDHPAWCRETVCRLREHGFVPRFRPHPLAAARGVDYGVDCAVDTGPLSAAFAAVAGVVIFNSTVGVLAAIAGVPAIAADPDAVCAPVAARCLNGLRFCTLPDRAQWAHDLAYGQWTLGEMRAGAAWRHLEGQLAAA